MVWRDLVPMDKRIAGPRGTGKPLPIAARRRPAPKRRASAYAPPQGQLSGQIDQRPHNKDFRYPPRDVSGRCACRREEREGGRVVQQEQKKQSHGGSCSAVGEREQTPERHPYKRCTEQHYEEGRLATERIEKAERRR